MLNDAPRVPGPPGRGAPAAQDPSVSTADVHAAVACQTLPADARPPSRVLVAEDHPALLRAFARVLGAAGFDVTPAENGRAAAHLIASSAFDVIVSDIGMPEMDGIALLRAVRTHDLDVPVVLMTGAPDVATASQAVEYGALQYLTKPVDLAKLEQTVRRAVQLHRIARIKREAFTLSHMAALGGADRAGLEANFARMLEGFWMAYQPIVRARDGAVFGYEALLRSTEPALPHPGAVLDAAERLGRLDDLGRRIRAAAAAPMAAAPERGLLFVNLHPRDLLDAELLAGHTPLAAIASRVVLEITERSSLGEIPDVRGRVAALRRMGFRIAIDDLGAGYAGLTSFATLEPEFVKLDMSLVRDVEQNATKQKLIRSMAALCRDMGMSVIAEGIETVAEREAVVALGCDLLQGYALARPGRAFPDVVG